MFFGLKALVILLGTAVGLWRLHKSLSSGLEKPANIKQLEKNAERERAQRGGAVDEERRRMFGDHAGGP